MEDYIQHRVSPTDTLAGVALKYGITVSINHICNYLYGFG